MMCWGIPTAAVVVALIVFSMAMNSRAAATDPVRYKYTIKVVYTMDHCEWCDELEAYMRKHGYSTTTKYITEAAPAVVAYPTVYYTDNFFDQGQRIKAGTCKLPAQGKPIERLHLRLQ